MTWSTEHDPENWDRFSDKIMLKQELSGANIMAQALNTRAVAKAGGR
jgi:hypothetical protein